MMTKTQNNPTIINEESLFANKLSVLLFPIIAAEGFLISTIIIFAFGPWPWPVENPVTLYTFLFFVQLALFLGYLSGLKTKPSESIIKFNIYHFTMIGIAITLMISPLLVYARSGGDFGLLIEGFTNPGEAYKDSRENVLSAPQSGIFEYLSVLFSPITYPLLPLGVFFWSKLTTPLRIFLVASFVARTLPFIASGTNKGIFDLFFITTWLFLARHPKVINNLMTLSFIKKKRTLLLVLLPVIFLIFFLSGMKGRYQDNIPLHNSWINIDFNTSNFMVSLLPEEGQKNISTIFSYLTQGYYGLSLALDEPFVPMYGIGNSRFYTWLIGEKLLGDKKIYDSWYVARVSQHTSWDQNTVWSTIYPWIANDVTFFGVIIVVFLVGRFLAISWKDLLFAENPFAVVTFIFLIIAIFSFNMNNYVLQTAETAVAAVIWFTIWLISRKKINLT